jgi:APA family basic amino acid/polyamine antiporter
VVSDLTVAGGSQTSGPPIFSRKATGLVREVSPVAAIAFIASAIPVGVALSILLFGVFVAFPGANIEVAIIICLATIPVVGGVFALLSATMPRIGGDYLYCSRIVHPTLGMASNFMQFVSVLVSVAAAGYLFAKAGLSSAFATVGVLTGSTGWLTASNTVGKAGWVFACAAALVIFFTVLSMFGTKVVLRWVAWFYFLSVGSVILAFITLLFVSHAQFVTNLNAMSRPFTHTANTYSATVAAGIKGGLRLPDHGGYSTGNTLGAVFTTLAITGALWYTAYISAEMKGAGRRRRQLSIGLGTSFAQGIFVLLCVILFVHVIGYDFFASASTGFYGAPAPGFYNFFTGVAANSPFLGILVSGLLLLGFPPFLYTNLGIAQRLPFAWAFDGIVPARLARVNPRTHTPNVVIIGVGVICIGLCAWAAFASSFLQVISYCELLGYGPFIPVGIAAMVFPYWRPDIYKGSPSDISVAGVPLISIGGFLLALIGVGVIVLMAIFHTNLGDPTAIVPLAVMAGSALAGVCIYLAAQRIQAQRGVDIAVGYKSLPAD